MKYVLLSVLILPALRAHGQDSLRSEEVSPFQTVVRPGPVIKVTPLSLIGPDARVGAAIEVPLKPRLSLQPEIDLAATALTRQAQPDWRLRTEIRYYISPSLSQTTKGKSLNGLYGAAGITLARPATRKPAEAVPAPVGAPLSIAERNQINRHIYGLQAKMGYQGAPIPKNPRFIVDVYVGVGFRVISVREASDSLSSPAYLSAGGALRPVMTGGVKIGWLITTEKPVKKK